MQADAPLALTTLPLDGGAVGDDVTLLAAADLLGSRAEGEHVLASVAGTDPLAVTLRLGDAVVHDRYGVGILRGLAPFDAPDGGASETITVEYAKGAMRQVPVIEAGKLWRYGGEGEAVKRDTLDGKSWEKRRAEIDASIVELGQLFGEKSLRIQVGPGSDCADRASGCQTQARRQRPRQQRPHPGAARRGGGRGRGCQQCDLRAGRSQLDLARVGAERGVKLAWEDQPFDCRFRGWHVRPAIDREHERCQRGGRIFVLDRRAVRVAGLREVED